MFRRLVILLGLAHFLSDCISGYLIGHLSEVSDFTEIGLLILLYNALAFAMQLPIGVWIDSRKNHKTFCIIALTSVALSLFLVNFSPIAAIICAGLGSAVFHVTGGMVSLTASPNSSVNPGIFAGPGVVGLMLGGWLSVQNPIPNLILVASMGFLLIFIFLQKFPQLSSQSKTTTSAQHLDTHDYIMIVMLMAIAMRSAVWNIFQQIYVQNYEFLFYMAASAMVGKIFGGFLADRFGWRNYAFFALLLATPLLTWGEKNAWFLLPGIALLQSVTPVAMAAMYKLLPRFPATASGITLGLAIALGGLIFYTGFSVVFLLNIAVPVMGFGAMMLYFFTIKPKNL